LNAGDLKVKRMSADIPGSVVCQKAGLHRSRLSDIERGVVTPRSDELRRIDAAISEIVKAKQQLTRLASEAGISLTGVRL
jgi:predicted transcriptional regulator